MTVAPKLLPLRIRLPYTTEEEFVEKYGSNVGRGGVFIATRALKEEGTALAFEFVLADGTRMLRGEGVVVKAQVDEGSGRSGMTVRFVKLDAPSKALLDRLVARRTGETHAPPEAPPAPVAMAPPARVEKPPAPPASPPPGVSGGTAPSRLPTAPPPGLVRRTSPSPASAPAPAPGPATSPPAPQAATASSRPVPSSGPAEAPPSSRAPTAPAPPPEPGVTEAPTTRAAQPEPHVSEETAAPATQSAPRVIEAPATPPASPEPRVAEAPAARPRLLDAPRPETPAPVPPEDTRRAPELKGRRRTVLDVPSRHSRGARRSRSGARHRPGHHSSPCRGVPRGRSPAHSHQRRRGRRHSLGAGGGCLGPAPRRPRGAGRGRAGSPARRHWPQAPARPAGPLATAEAASWGCPSPSPPMPAGDARHRAATAASSAWPTSPPSSCASSSPAASRVPRSRGCPAVLVRPRPLRCPPACRPARGGRARRPQRPAHLNAPAAATLAYGHGRGLARKRVLVIDLGGGGLEVSVMQVTGDDLEVVTTGCEPLLGGMDFDARIAEALTPAEAPPRALARLGPLRTAAETAKMRAQRAGGGHRAVAQRWPGLALTASAWRHSPPTSRSA